MGWAKRIQFAWFALLDTLPWLLPTLGSLIVAWANGHPAGVGIGVGIVLIAAGPVAFASFRRRLVDHQDLMDDARERMIADEAAALLREAASLEGAARQQREARSKEAIPELLHRIIDKVYDDRPDLRLVYYIVDEKTGEGLVVENTWGRLDEARDFPAGGERAEIALKHIRATDDSYVCDNTALLPAAYGVQGRSYRSFVFAPIRSDQEAFGMLTLDSPKVGGISHRDGEMMETVASMVAFRLALAERGRKRRGRGGEGS